MPSAGCSDGSLFLIAPHSDDVAWSIGDLVHDTGGFAARTLVTVFSESDYATDATRGNQAAVTKCRLAEDAAFCAAAGLAFVPCGIEDGLLRGYPDLRSMFTVEDCKRDPVFARVADALAARIPDRDDVCIVAPIGIGRHVDHAVVREAVKRVFRRAAMLFYEDLPYVWWLDDASLERVIRERLGERHRPLYHIIRDLERRQRDVSFYASQPAEAFLRRFAEAALRTRDGRFVERLWSAEEWPRIERLPFLATRPDLRERLILQPG